MEWSTIDGAVSLVAALALMTVFGLLNLLSIATEAQRAPSPDRSSLRRLGVGAAVLIRLALVFALLLIVSGAQTPILSLSTTWLEIGATAEALALFLGGICVIAAGLRAAPHLLMIDDLEQDVDRRGQRTRSGAAAAILLSTLWFGAAAVTASMVFTRDFTLLAIAATVSGGTMLWFSGRVVDILTQFRRLQLLGLLSAFVVGLALLSAGGAAAGLVIFGGAVTAVTKPTLLFIIVVCVVAALAARGFARRLAAEKQLEARRIAGRAVGLGR